MQPQDAGTGFDWSHIFSAFGGAIVGAVSSLAAWFWRMARIEPTLRADFEKSLNAAEKRVDGKIEEEMGHFRETLLALREHIARVEHNGVRKEDFDEFRREHREDLLQIRKESREDFADLKRNIAQMLGQRS